MLWTDFGRGEGLKRIGTSVVMKSAMMLAFAAAVLSGCEDPSRAYTYQKAPSTFTPEEMAGFDSLPTLSNGFGDGNDTNSLCGIVKVKAASYTAADRKIIGSKLRARGMSARDVEIILDPTKEYGTRMSWNGLKCKLNYFIDVNMAFYPGSGHEWQAVLRDNEYVYLRGDGTEAGMYVYAWN